MTIALPAGAFRDFQSPLEQLGFALCDCVQKTSNRNSCVTTSWLYLTAGGITRARAGSYRVQVVEADGTTIVRQSKAPDETIDMAVEYAKTVGARLIWLDQECLPQDSSQEQEDGIQAMDILY